MAMETPIMYWCQIQQSTLLTAQEFQSDSNNTSVVGPTSCWVCFSWLIRPTLRRLRQFRGGLGQIWCRETHDWFVIRITAYHPASWGIQCWRIKRERERLGRTSKRERERETYIYIYIHIYIYIYTCIYIYTKVSIYTDVYIYMHLKMCTARQRQRKKRWSLAMSGVHGQCK